MNTQLQKLKEQHEIEEWEFLTEEAKRQSKEKVLFFLGGIHTVGKILNALSSQKMRALESFQTEKMYLALGFDNFVDFLNSDFSPLSKSQYYEQSKILENEGDGVFDLLNQIGIPRSTRKMLGKGNIQLDGETVIISDNSTGEQTSIELKDRARLLETLTALADANADKTKKLDKQKTQIERGEAEVLELRKKLDTAKNQPGTTSVLEFWMNACRAVDALTEQVKKITDREEKAHGAQYIDALNLAVYRLEQAYKGDEKSDFTEVIKTNHIDLDNLKEVAASLSDEELAELMD